MEQFSHDLTLALEETSRIRAGHYWGGRRRTRSTGNLREFIDLCAEGSALVAKSEMLGTGPPHRVRWLNRFIYLVF